MQARTEKGAESERRSPRKRIHPCELVRCSAKGARKHGFREGSKTRRFLPSEVHRQTEKRVTEKTGG